MILRHVAKFLNELMAVTALGIGVAMPASAQQAPLRSAEPSQVERRLAAPAQPSPGVEFERPEEPEPSLEQAPLRFVLTGVVIEGSTVYPEGAFASLYEDRLATEITLDDVKALAAAVTDRYRRDGYVLSRAVVEPQDLDFGLLHIRVIEGYVASVVFAGNIGGSKALLDSYVRRIVDERPLTLATLERYLLLVSDIPGLRARASVAASADDPAAHQLILEVDHRTWQGFAAIDNRGTRTVGPWTASAALVGNSLLGLHERTRLRASTVPDRPEELVFFDLSQDYRVGGEGTQLGLTLSRSAISAGGNLKPLDVSSAELHADARALHPLLRSRAASLWLTGDIDLRDSYQRAVGVELYDDQLRVLRAGLVFAGTDPLAGVDNATLEFSRGLSILGASPRDPARRSRPDGRPDFDKLVATFSRFQPIRESWGVQASAAAQKSFQPLFSAEQFAIGGPAFGRGFDPAEYTGDDGAGLSVELQRDVPLLPAWLRPAQLYAFYDLGAVWNGTGDGGTSRDVVSSAGVGLRLRLADTLLVGIEAAKPLFRDVITEGNRDFRLFFSLSAGF
jgi:hemolysin activation/secretion protein